MKALQMPTRRICLFLAFCVALTLFLPSASGGDAEVSRTKNVQYPQLEPGNSDVTRYRNLEPQELDPNNGDITRYRNLLQLELVPNNADVTRYRNLVFLAMDEVGYQINITRLITTDQSRVPTSDFVLGDIVQFEFTIKNVGTSSLSNGLVTTMVQDPAGEPVFLSYTFENLAAQQSKDFIIGYRISDSSLTGNHAVKVMVLTNWPSQGGIGLDTETKTFTVS